MGCVHEFVGHTGGVTCKRCGLRMSVDEYRKYLHPKEKETAVKKPKQTRNRKMGESK